MQRIKFMWKLFLNQPAWFKLVITITFLASIIFSSSYFSENNYYESISKLAAAIFFSVFGFKTRGNRQTSIIFFILSAFCLLLAIWAFF
ncbi:hypothetical protein SAMN05518871_10728 [Psychrobacillus sp. OK028]|uniref:hypothetical protein n=1 Tax=Psychrobacillus sp. OK028 TaxID=1884359 RepID=UPI0008869905|nr:hypothetical protein [Psychrobacillus sp. OK028]SDN70955.1 hypothetical protein SAMN05518871_10728 [Psychrobacillus sp. OK028]